MDESRLLVVGANGQLGKALCQRFPKAHTSDIDTLDITHNESVAMYPWQGIDTIVNASAYTNVDGAETSEGRILAWKVNAQGVANLAKTAITHNLTLVHISSDYAFDGTKKEPYEEGDPIAPLGVYAQSKLAGEIAATIVPNHYVLRTSWLIGDGPNFVRTMVNLAEKNVSPTVVNDQIGRLTFTPTLVDAIEHVLRTQAAHGIYHVSNDGEAVSWAEVTREIFKDLGRDDLTVTNTTTEDYFAGKPGIAPRPKQSTFDLSKIKATGLSLRDWRNDLKAYITHEQAHKK